MASEGLEVIPMVRTQIQFDPEQYEEVRTLAHRERISISEAVRRLVSRGLNPPGAEAVRPRAAALLDLAGVARGGPADLSARHDDYLGEAIEP
jgi:hypothetical protein